jgi:curved DNA-binding protein CbpA
MNIFQSITLEHTDMEILSLINGKHHLKDILTLSPVTDFETLKTIASFFRIGIVTTKEKDEAPSMVSAGDVMEEKAVEAPAEFLEKVEELYDQCESLEYYLFLGVNAQAGEDEIQKAYYNISKQYHPDRHFDFPEHDIKGKLIRISAYATEAHTMLSDPARRERYDRELSEEARSATDEAATDHASSEDLNIIGKEGPGEVVEESIDANTGNSEGAGQKPQEGSNSHYELGCAYMEMGLSDEAIKEFRIASSDPSRKTRCTTAVAECLADKGEHQNAIEELRNFMSELSADQEEYQEVKYALADIYEKKSDYDTALELYNEIYSHDAGYRDVARKVGTIRSML